MQKHYDHINPSHYVKDGKECWEIMIEEYGVQAFVNFCTLNAFKYRFRAGLKPGNSTDQDIKKAEWYERKIEELTTI